MKFDIEFKKKCFEVFQGSSIINELMTNLEADQVHTVRRIIEDYLDDINRILKPEVILDDGERLIYNSKVKHFKRVHAVYSELMESINIELDDISSLRVEIDKKINDRSIYNN